MQNVEHSLEGVVRNDNVDNDKKDWTETVTIGQMITWRVKIPMDVLLDMVVEVGVVCCEEENEQEQERLYRLLGLERSSLKDIEKRELKWKWRAEVRTHYSLMFRYK